MDGISEDAIVDSKPNLKPSQIVQQSKKSKQAVASKITPYSPTNDTRKPNTVTPKAKTSVDETESDVPIRNTIPNESFKRKTMTGLKTSSK